MTQLLLCCSFASASSTSRNPSSLSIDCSNSEIYTICRDSLILTPSGCLPQKRFTKKYTGLKLCSVRLLIFFDWYCHRVLCTHTNIYMPRFSPSGFFRPFKCPVASPDPWAHIWVPNVQCAFMCAYTHTCTHIHSYPRGNIEKILAKSPSFLMWKIRSQHQQQVPCID